MDPLSLLAGAAIGGSVAVASRRLLTHRPRHEQGLADHLPWAVLVGDGVILCKDATFLGGFTLRGADLSSAPHEALNQSARTINKMLTQMGPGFSLEVNIHRQEHRAYPCAGVRDFPTEVLTAVDREREKHFVLPGSYYETSHTLLISFTPPREAVRKIEGLFVSGPTSSVNYAAMLDEYQRSLDEIEGFLSPSFEIERMDSARLVTECHQCLSGDTETILPDGGYLCYSLASGDFIPSFVPRFRDQHLHLVTITSYGAAIQVASGDFFNTLSDQVRWHMRFLPLSRAAAESRIRMIQKRWFSKRKGLAQFMPGSGEDGAALEDSHAVAMQEETGRALAEVTSGESRFGFLSNTVVIRDHDLRRGQFRATALVQRAREAGFAALVESTNSPSAFLGSLPGLGAVNLRRLLVSSRVVSHLFPTTMPWAGDAHNPSKLFAKHSPPLMMVGGRGATPFRLHLHHGDVGHCLVVGATGAGKSVLVGSLMMSWLRYSSSRVICFDVGRTHKQLTEKAHGEHINLGEDSMHTLQPLRHLDTEVDRLWAESWISGICALAGVPIQPDERGQLGHAIRLVANEAPEHRTLTTLRVNLPPRLGEVLDPYTARGTFGQLFDGIQKDEETHTRMRTIELSSVLDMGEAVVAPLLMVLFRQVERSLDGKPTLIVIEEAWAALMRSEFSDRLQQWLLTLRKQNGSVVIVAHNPVQIRQLPNSSIITDSCPTRILLPNPEARVPEHADVYRFLDLSSREIETLAKATQKREYYYTSPRGSRLFDLCLGAKARALLFPPKPGHSQKQAPSPLSTNGHFPIPAT